MARRRELEPEPEPERPRFRPLGEEREWWRDEPRRREHVIEQIRRFGIQEWHAYWDARTPLAVRRELIAQALLAGPLDEDES